MFSFFKKKKSLDPKERSVQNQTVTVADGEALFKEVWDLFATNRANDFFYEGITSMDYTLNEDDGMIDLVVTRNEQVICFNLDRDSIYMSNDATDEDETIEMTTFVSLADLQARMNHFVVSHT